MIHFRRFLSLLLCLLLTLGAACATADTAGLSRALEDWLDREAQLRFSATFQVDTLLPFNQDRLDMINKLLAHTSLQVTLEQEDGGSLTALSLLVDSQPMFSLTERAQDESFSLETSLLPNRVLKSSGLSPIALLAGDSAQAAPAATDAGSADTEAAAPAGSFDMLTAFSEAEASYQALISACEPYAEKKKANYKIKNIGTAKWSQIARLTPEQSDAVAPLIHAVLKSGMDEDYQRTLDGVSFGKGFIVGLYKSAEDGNDMAVYMKGDLIYPDGSVYRLAYQWSFISSNDQRKDAYKYEAVKAQKPADNRTLSALVTRGLPSGPLVLSGSGTSAFKVGTITQTHVEKLDLSGKQSGNTRSFTGSITQQRTSSDDDITHTVTFTPDLSILTEGDQGIVSGSIRVETKKEKTVLTAMTLTFGDVPAEALEEVPSLYTVTEEAPDDASTLPPASIVQNLDEAPEADVSDYLVTTSPVGIPTYLPPDQPTALSLENMTLQQHSQLMGEMSQNLAARLLAAFAKLPEADRQLLRDGLTDADYEKFLSLISGL